MADQGVLQNLSSARGAAQPGQKPIKETDAGDPIKPKCRGPDGPGLYTDGQLNVPQ